MALKILVKVTENGLMPWGSYAQDFQDAAYKIGSELWCNVTKPRNQKHHNKLFAWLTPLFENQDEFGDIERLRSTIIIKAGFYHEKVYDEPQVLSREIIADMRSESPYIVFIMNSQNMCVAWRKPHSLKFSKKDQHEFEACYKAMCDVAMRDYGFSVEDWDRSKHEPKRF